MADKRIIATALVLVVGVGLFGAVLLLQSQPQYETSYHFQANYPSDVVNIVVLRIDHLLDCNLTIDFVDNSSLWYSVDVELYEPGPSIPVVGTGDNIYINQDAESPVRVKSLDITLGTGYAYRIAVGGHLEDESSNINAVLEIDNGAVLGEYAGFNMEGDLHLSFGENVDISQGGYLVHMSGGIDDVHLMIDLPEGLDGRLYAVSPDQSFTLLGWSLTY
ncbi:MAG: hypothetical protein ACFFB7_06970, partial [Candidatus Sifarchaeia archaeon]